MATDVVRIGLLGAGLNRSNRGVRALGISVVGNVIAHRPGAQVFQFVGNRDDAPQSVDVGHGTVDVGTVPYRLSPRARLREHLFWILAMAWLQRVAPGASLRRRIVASNPCLSALSGAALLGDIRGGDSFSDLYGARRCFIGCLPALVVILLGRRLVLLPQTLGPFRRGWARALARYTLSHAERIYVRDHASRETALELLGPSAEADRIRFCPDVAFTLPSRAPAQGDIEPALAPRGRPLIGININGLLYRGGYTGANMFVLRMDYRAFVTRLVGAVLRETDADVLLVPHEFTTPDNPYGDDTVSREVMAAVPAPLASRLHIVAGERSPTVLKGVIGRCDFFVGSRMHACIAALSQGIPAVGVAYSGKFRGVFETVGWGHGVVDARETGEDEAVARVLEVYRARDTEREKLRAAAETAAQQVRAAFRELMELAEDAS